MLYLNNFIRKLFSPAKKNKNKQVEIFSRATIWNKKKKKKLLTKKKIPENKNDCFALNLIAKKQKIKLANVEAYLSMWFDQRGPCLVWSKYFIQ